MNLFELLILICAVVGLVAGAITGYEYAGVVGWVVGAIAGVVGGWLSYCVLIGVLIGVPIFFAIEVPRWQAHRILSPYFDRYWTKERTAQWEDVKEHLRGGQPVVGKVVVAKYYERFIDIGCNFPALLNAVDPATSTVLPDPPALGDDVEATILEYDDLMRMIVLTKTNRHWLVFGGVPVGYLVGNPPLREDGTAIFHRLSNKSSQSFAKELYQGAVSCQLSSDEGDRDVLVEQRGKPGSYIHITMLPTNSQPGDPPAGQE